MKPFNLNDLLRRVSRSFYLTLHVLPRAIRPQLKLAYLLARATDTVADTEVISVSERQRVLDDLCRSIQATCAGETPVVPEFAAFMRTFPADGVAENRSATEKAEAERTLLGNFAILLTVLRQFSEADREQIRTVLDTITRGQQLDLQRFGACVHHPAALTEEADLDDYTYAVAGCVGEFWTQLCLTHLFPHTALNSRQLLADAIRFGKGLQLVNILRDVPEDLRQGRCYVPSAALSRYGLQPADLLLPATMPRFRPLYNEYLGLAEDHLRAGWRYTTTLPFHCVRLRLACAWPLLIGLQTLARLRQGNILADPRIKLTRPEIRRIMFRSLILYPNRRAWNHMFDGIYHAQGKY